MKTLITFVHFENERSKSNLDFFLKLGLTNSPDHHFNFVINSSSGVDQIPNRDNISVIKGHNEGYDFGGYSQSLESVNLDEFDRFIFMNDTSLGPFLPDYLDSASWVNIIGNLITDEIKLVGPTWNFSLRGKGTDEELETQGGELHIQSYFFATDLKGVKILLDAGIFSTLHLSKHEIIISHEIGMSQIILQSGFKIKPLQLSQYNDHKHGDICYVEAYYGTTVNPLEIMFIKANRLRNKTIDNYIKWKIQKTEKY